MRFWLPKNPNVALMLVPWFVPCGQKIEDMMLNLHHRLKYTPDDTFVCLVIDNDLIKGVVVAYCRKSDVFIWQARNQGLTRAVADRVFDGLCHWARGKDFNRITTIPNRAAKLWKRRWGFRPMPGSQIIYKEI